MNAQQRQQLQAMGILRWEVRPGGLLAEAERAGVMMDPSDVSAGLLVVADRPRSEASMLADDLQRALGRSLAWGSVSLQGEPAETVAEEQLLTHILVLGAHVAHELFGAPGPKTIGATRVVVAPALDELMTSAQARRDCWSACVRAGCVQQQ